MITPDWTFAASLYLPKHHCMLYRDDRLGLQLQVMTKTRGLFRGSPAEYYFIDGVKRVFRNEETMIRHLARRLNRRARARAPRMGTLKRIGYAMHILS